jgi:hypothetical protein
MKRIQMSEEAYKIQAMRADRGHTIDDMLASLGMKNQEYRNLCWHKRLHEVIERYEKVPIPAGRATSAANMEKLREMRAERKHSYAQMLRVLSLSESGYQRLRNAGRLDDVIREYEKIPPEAPIQRGNWGGMTETDIARKMREEAHRPKLPPVGAVIQRGSEKVTVIRHTGADSILVEWTDGEGKRRRAEWTTTPHPRCTDLGDWAVRK